MKRVFKRVLPHKAWDEIHLFDYENNTMETYMQDRQFGFTFSHHKLNIEKWGYPTINVAIKELNNRNYLGIEQNYDEQMENETQGKINLKVEQERIKNNPLEYKRRVAGLGM